MRSLGDRGHALVVTADQDCEDSVFEIVDGHCYFTAFLVSTDTRVEDAQSEELEDVCDRWHWVLVPLNL